MCACRTGRAAASSESSDDEVPKNGSGDEGEPTTKKGKDGGGDPSSSASSSSSESKSSHTKKGKSKSCKGTAAHKEGKQKVNSKDAGDEAEDVPNTDSFPWCSMDFEQLDALWSDNVQDFSKLDHSKEKGCIKRYSYFTSYFFHKLFIHITSTYVSV